MRDVFSTTASLVSPERPGPGTEILEEAFLVTGNSLMCMVLKSATEGCPSVHAVHSNTFYNSYNQFSAIAGISHSWN